MGPGGFELDDVITNDGLNADAITREAARFLERWTRDDLRTAATRTKRLAVLGVAALVLALYVPTTTGIGQLVLDAVVWALVVEIVAFAAVYYVLVEVDAPPAVLEGDLGGVNLLGVLVLVLLAAAALRSRPGRTVWRFAFKNAAFAPTRRPPDLGEPPPIVTWGLRAAGAAIVILLADVTWSVVTRTALGPAVYSLLRQAGSGGGTGVDLQTGLSTSEAVVLYGVLLFVGILVAVTLSVRR